MSENSFLKKTLDNYNNVYREKRIVQKLKYMLLKIIYKISVTPKKDMFQNFLLVLILVSIIYGSNNNNNKTNTVILKNIFAGETKEDRALEAFKHFKKASGEEILWWFVKKFKDFKYKMGESDERNKLVDCSGSMNIFFEDWGSLLEIKNVMDTYKYFNYLKKNGMIEQTYGNRIKEKDIVFIRRTNSYNAPPTHIAIVVRKVGNWITYVDFNGATGFGIWTIPASNNTIVATFNISQEAWMAKEIEKK